MRGDCFLVFFCARLAENVEKYPALSTFRQGRKTDTYAFMTTVPLLPFPTHHLGLR